MNPAETSIPVNDLPALIEDPEQLAALAGMLSSGLLIYNQDKKLVLCNEAAEQITGFRANQLGDLFFIGQELRFFNENRQQIAWQELPCVKAFTEGAVTKDCTIGFSSTSKSIVWIRGNVYPVYNAEAGQLRYIVMSFINITGQKRAEEKITHSSPEWHTLFNNSRNAVFLLDTDYRIKVANLYAKKLLRQFRSENEEMEGSNFLDLILPQRKNFVHDMLDRAKSGDQVEYEALFKKYNGEDLWLQMNYTPVTDDAGKIKEICITITNITRIRQETQRTLEEESRWRLALESGRDGVWEYNFETQEAYYSPLYKAMLGYTDAEFENDISEWASRLHPDDVHKVEEMDHLYVSGQIDHHAIEYRIKNKAGGYTWILDKGMVLEKDSEGKPVRLIGTHNNIHERKLMEEGLRQSEQRFSSFMSNTPTMNWIIDEHAIFRYFNKQYIAAFQLSEEAVGKSVYEFFPEHICKKFIHNNNLVWSTGEAMETVEEGVGPDGAQHWYHIFKFPLASENGTKLLGGVALDITKKVAMEKKLAEEEAKNRREMIQAIMNAQENERKEIADELHDNVNQILSSAKLMLESASNKTAGEGSFIEKGLYYLNDAIQEIRKLSHNLTPGLLRDISLEAAVEDWIHNINSTGKLFITFNKSGDFSQAAIRPEVQLALLRIAQEQLNNIIRHAQTEAALLELSVSATHVSLLVEDGGTGFDPAVTKKGIGLNNIFNRVEYFNGRVELRSAAGQGCRLRVEIPLSS